MAEAEFSMQYDEPDEESVQISLFDGQSGLEYRFMVRPEDAERANADQQFATSLLQHAKINYEPYEVTEETGNSAVVASNNAHTQKSFCEDATFKTWSYNATLALISAVKERYEDLNHPKKRKHVWDFISEHLQSLNVVCTPKECHTKYRNLIRTYNNVKDNKNKTGRGNIRFHFYDEMDDLLGDKPTNTSEHIIDIAKENDVALNSNGECSNIKSSTSNQMLNVVDCQSDIDTDDTTSKISDIESKKNRKRKATRNDTVTLKLDYIKQKKAFIEEEKERRQRESEKRDSRNEEKLKLRRERNEIENQKLKLLKMYFENKT